MFLSTCVRELLASEAKPERYPEVIALQTFIASVSQNAEPKLMEFIYDALGRRVETIEYIDPATGAVWDGQGGRPAPRRTRHVYFGLEMIQEYSCGADGTTPPVSGAWPCETSMPLVQEFLRGDPATRS